MTDMAEFSAGLMPEDIPTDMVALMRRSFLDTMGVAAIGTTTELARIVTRTAPMLFGASDAAQGAAARMILNGTPVSAAGAAFQGAFTIDSIDAHDSISLNKGHVGSAAFPALLAMADAARSAGRPIGGATFLTWISIAYEVSARAGQVQHATCADYHTSGAWTAVGVAAACARALGLTPDQIRHAAGIGEYHGPRSQMMRCIDFPTMVRDGVGWGAPSGVTAAFLAGEGFTGAPALTCDSAQAAPFWADLGQAWRTVEHTSYKPYPCCRWAHPALDAVRDLMATHALAAEDVAGADIRTFHNATRLAGPAPQNPCEFAYSIAFPVAAMIRRGQLGVAEMMPATLRDPDILRLSQAINLIDDPELTERSHHGTRWAQVTLILQNGTRLEAAPRTPRGDPDQPLSDAEIAQKYHLFADDILGTARAGRIEQAIAGLGDLTAIEFSVLLDDLHAPV